MFQLSRKRILSPTLFSALEALSGLDGSHQPWGGHPAFPRLPTHLLTSSRNSFTDTSRSHVLTRYLGILWLSQADR